MSRPAQIFLNCLLCVSMTAAAGCQATGMGRGWGLNQTSERENPVDGDPWVKEAGDFARSEHEYEPVQDPLGIRKYFVSDKAQQIERNLGVGP